MAGVTSQEFLVAVAAELFGERAGISAKLFEVLNDAFGHERLHVVEPNILGGTVNQKDRISVTHLADCVTKNDVQVDLVELVFGGSEGFAAGPLAEVGKLGNRWAGFTPLDKLGILRGVAEVFVVAETVVSKQMVDIVGGEILEGVGPVQCVTWTHIRRRRGWVGEKKENIVLANKSGLGRGLGIRGCCRSGVGNVNFRFNVIVIISILCGLRNRGKGRGWRYGHGGGGGFRRSEQHGTEPATALFTEVRVWM